MNRIKLPFGIITIVDEVSANQQIYNTMYNIFRSDMSRYVTIFINRYTDQLFEIKFTTSSYNHNPEEENYKFKLKLGDVFRLPHGKTMSIESIEKDGLIIVFDDFDKKRLEFSERKIKLKKINEKI